jgi:hypothetical protein
MAKTTLGEGVSTETAIGTPRPEPKYMIVEHQVCAVPSVTKIAYWDGDVLCHKSIPNPCPLKPGGEYTKAEIEALGTSA